MKTSNKKHHGKKKKIKIINCKEETKPVSFIKYILYSAANVRDLFGKSISH